VQAFARNRQILRRRGGPAAAAIEQANLMRRVLRGPRPRNLGTPRGSVNSSAGAAAAFAGPTASA